MLLANLRHDYVRTYYKPLDACDFTEIEAAFDTMIEEAHGVLKEEGATPDLINYQRFLDIRYIGQEFPILTPVSAEDIVNGDVAALRAAFDRIHDRRYGHQAVDEPVEVVNLRLTATGEREHLSFPGIAGTAGEALIDSRPVIFGDPTKPVISPIYDRDRLAAGEVVVGPAAVVEYASTTVLFEGDSLKVAPSGELIIEIAQGEMA
jgi:N-methylhydantoinase A